ncbi:hypothetical protein BGX38DRAFT_1333924 [Terfezia claveryi]|nr:hypothetical protein BGX38DRAFT_1333924 [Terfezia claveryi]
MELPVIDATDCKDSRISQFLSSYLDPHHLQKSPEAMLLARQFLHCLPCDPAHEFPQTLCLTGLDPARFEKLYADLEPQLERSRMPIDYDADTCTWIIQCASGAHESGAAGWAKMVQILQSINMPMSAKSGMVWVGGQPDLRLSSASGAGLSCKTPDASLTFGWLTTSSIVLETGLSESMSKLRLDMRRLLQGGSKPETDSGLQCVILLRIHPVARRMARGEKVDWPSGGANATNDDAMTIEVWRNARDEDNDHKIILLGGDKRGGSKRQQTNPILVSQQVYSLSQLQDDFIPEFKIKVLESQVMMESALRAAKLCKRKPPIPRNVPMAAAPHHGEEPYFTIYFEDLVTQSEVPRHLRNLIYVNVPYRIFIDAYLETHLAFLLPNDTNVKDNNESELNVRGGHIDFTGFTLEREETPEEQAEDLKLVEPTVLKRQREQTPEEEAEDALELGKTTIAGDATGTKVTRQTKRGKRPKQQEGEAD